MTRVALIGPAVPVLLLGLVVPIAAQDRSADERELLRLHDELIEAHRSGDVGRWMAVESPAWVSANGGRVSFPGEADRRAGRAAYLQRTTFEAYRDLRAPLVQVSEDGSLGWVIAEVEVRGTMEGPTGSEPFHDVWAWVELYRKEDGAWRMVGNASNRRPGGAEASEPPAETAEAYFASIPATLAVRGPEAWLTFFEETPAFFMASDGMTAFADRADAEAFLAEFAPRVETLSLRWIEPRFEVLAPDVVAVVSAYDEEITMVDGTVSTFGGQVSGVLRRTAGAWRLQHLHWSSPPPDVPLPTPGGHDPVAPRVGDALTQVLVEVGDGHGPQAAGRELRAEGGGGPVEVVAGRLDARFQVVERGAQLRQDLVLRQRAALVGLDGGVVGGDARGRRGLDAQDRREKVVVGGDVLEHLGHGAHALPGAPVVRALGDRFGEALDLAPRRGLLGEEVVDHDLLSGGRGHRRVARCSVGFGGRAGDGAQGEDEGHGAGAGREERADGEHGDIPVGGGLPRPGATGS